MRLLQSLVLLPAVLHGLAAGASIFSSSDDADQDASVWANVGRSNGIKEKKSSSSSSSSASSRVLLRDRKDWSPLRNREQAADWNPPADMAAALQEVWDHTLKTYNNGDVFGFDNYGWDQLEANNGAINYCVRWDSAQTVTQAQRGQIEAMLAAQWAQWIDRVAGYDDFPYANVTVRVVGYAVRDAGLLAGDTAGLDVYADDVDGDGIPQCATACGRFFHRDGDYSGCEAGGAERHYDQSLWLTDGFGGGAGGDWGQRVGTEYVLGAMEQESVHILLHEMGHSMGLDDFYDWTPTGQDSFIMNAGSSRTITDFDGWMLRRWWYELSRDRGWTALGGFC